MNLRVLKRLVDIKKAPSRLSTPSAMFLPVHWRISVEWACFVKGGLQSLGSGSLMRMYLFKSRFRMPILNRNILVTNESFMRQTLFSSALSSFSYLL